MEVFEYEGAQKFGEVLRTWLVDRLYMARAKQLAAAQVNAHAHRVRNKGIYIRVTVNFSDFDGNEIREDECLALYTRDDQLMEGALEEAQQRLKDLQDDELPW